MFKKGINHIWICNNVAECCQLLGRLCVEHLMEDMARKFPVKIERNETTKELAGNYVTFFIPW